MTDSPLVPEKIERWVRDESEQRVKNAFVGLGIEDGHLASVMSYWQPVVALALQSAYARGRREGMEEAAGIAVGLIRTNSESHGEWNRCASTIAAAIRAAARATTETEET